MNHPGVQKAIDAYVAATSLTGPAEQEPAFEESLDRETLVALNLADTLEITMDDVRESLSPGKRRTIR